MALKIWLNGQMHDLSKFTGNRIFAFSGGVKKSCPKGVTFVNGEKKVLWQTGSMGFDSWYVSDLGYPNSVDTGSRVYGIFANENKVIFNVDNYVSRSDVSNVSSPYTENTVEHGAMTSYTRYSGGSNDYNADMYSLVNSRLPKVGGGYISFWNEYFTDNQVSINQDTMNVGVSTVVQEQQNGDGAKVNPYAGSTQFYFDTTGNGIVRVSTYSTTGSYPVSQIVVTKNYSIYGGTGVATINTKGYIGNGHPLLLTAALYDNRYVIFGGEYQATAGGSYVYSLKKVDLNTGAISTLLDNYTTPVTGVMVDGDRIVVTVGNSLIKMDIDGGNVMTYNSPNIMPTLVGKKGGYYYLTTTRKYGTHSYLNIEVVAENNFISGEVVQTYVMMVQTNAIPIISQNGYLCFAAIHYQANDVSADYTTASGRTATIRSNSKSGFTYKICRIRCY